MEYDKTNRIAAIKNAGTKEEIRTEYVVDSVEGFSRVLMAVERKTRNTVAGSRMKGTTGNKRIKMCADSGKGEI